jgi:hypothetical protein
MTARLGQPFVSMGPARCLFLMASRQYGVVHSQATDDGRQSLWYLARYVFRVAIGDRRIVAYDHGKVAFPYRRVGSNRPRKMTLDAMEFLHRFLQHVLPAGFQKVRHDGFLSPGSGTSLDAVRRLITLHNGASSRSWQC